MRRSMKRVNVKKENKPFKTLAIATIAGLSIIGVGQAQATTLDEVDLSQKPINTPTLDYLHNKDVLIPQKTFERDADGNIVKDSNNKPIIQEGTPILAPQSGYSLTELEAKEDGSKPDGDNVITKFEVKEVTRYYDKTTGELVANPISGTEYKVVQEKDLVPVYYSVNLKQTEYGNKDATNKEEKYYSWSKDGNGNNTLTAGIASSHDVTYYVDKDRLSERITTNQNGVNINKDFIGNTSSSTGGAIYNDSGTIGNITGDFIGNTASAGGAIFNNNSTIGNITGDFIGNTASAGGAIYNQYNGTIGDITGDFIGNIASAPGGAIYNAYNSIIGNITGDFIGNTAFHAPGGAIYNYNNGTIGDITGDFIGNTASSYGGAIYNHNNSTIGNITGDFIGNTASSSSSDSYGGAIYNSGTIGNITGDFIGNTAKSETGNAQGGAIWNNGSTIGNITGDFIGNYAKSETGEAKGGAIWNGGDTIGNITGDFIGNYASSSAKSTYYSSSVGGAIYNQYNGTIGDITGDFIGNYASSSAVASSATSYGGAIYNYGAIANITGDFIGNYASSFSSVKEAAAKGGSIYNYSGTIGNITGNFIGNYASADASNKSNSYGGVIYNAGNVSTSINDITSDFIGNYTTTSSYFQSNSSGGAIYNGRTIGNITGDFISNYAFSSTSSASKAASESYGGAIYNYGAIANITGDFIGNYASSSAIANSYAEGGAIYNHESTIGDITGNFIGNHVSSSSNFPYSSYAEGGAIYNCFGTIGDITGNFVGNYASSFANSVGSYFYGGAIYNYHDSTIGNITGDFIGNYASSSGSVSASISTTEAAGGAIRNGGTIGNITGDFIGNYASSSSSVVHGGAIFNGGTIGNIIGDFISNYASSSGAYAATSSRYNSSYGGAIDNYNGTIGDITGDFIGNYAKSEYKEAKGGAIYSYSDLSLVADNRTNTFKDNYTESQGVKDDNAIYIDNNATLNFTMKNNGKFYMADNIDGTVTKDSDGNITDTYSVNIQGDDINNTTFYMLNDIRNANVTFDNTTINAVNNQTHVYNFNTLTVNSDTNFVADVDLANAEMDRISATNYGTHNGNLNVVGMNLLSDATKDVTEIYFAQPGLKNNVVNGMSANGGYNLPSSAQTTFYTPIYKYNAIYDNRDDAGYFVFAKGDKILTPTTGGGTTVTPTGNPSDAFNPAVLAPSVASQAGANATMNQTFNYAFQNSDNFMSIPYLDRVAIKTSNRYALSPTGEATDVGTFSPLFNAQKETSSAWVKPYASFENIPLKNGPKVSNITYGTLVGFDTPIKSIRHGWDRTWTGYVGYNGASQRFSGVDAIQNGGLVGGTLTLYKNNFFNATTVSTGAIVGNNRTMYGTDNYTMLMAGVGNKTGYNIEFKEGKLIIQPSILLSYTFVNTFDYTNAAGVRIKNDPLHAIQIAPGVKFIANTKNGWQPYIGVNMVWNLLDKSKVSADDVRLPEMSIKPYIQYGVGVQKRFKDRYMAFGQAMIQNGGRNGISLTAGFRWSIGKEGKPLEKVQGVNNKTISSSGVDTSVNSVGAKSATTQAQPERKIIKQLSQTQRERIAKQYQNTTRTTSIGTLRQL